MSKIVLFSGKAGTGKTTASNYLLYLAEKNGYLLHFATMVKDIAKRYFWWDGVKDEKGRRLLQEIGRTGRNYK